MVVPPASRSFGLDETVPRRGTPAIYPPGGEGQTSYHPVAIAEGTEAGVIDEVEQELVSRRR